MGPPEMLFSFSMVLCSISIILMRAIITNQNADAAAEAKINSLFGTIFLPKMHLK
jgi:hypothetical protein